MQFIKKVLTYIALLLAIIIVVLLGFYLYIISQSTRQGDIVWQSCYRLAYLSWFVVPPSVKLQCATVSVPVDYDKPDGRQFVIPLTRLPSHSEITMGDLLILNGGPGSHSLDMGMMMTDAFGQRLRYNFHILGYAPRGISPSNPAISCGEQDDSDAQAYMNACIKHTGADILPFISSKQVVRDLEMIRQSLGDDTWSMLGYSYGTKLVAKYAEHYPSHLRAGVLDGVVDTSEELFTILHHQYKGAQVAFEAFMKNCPADCVFDRNQDPNQAFIAKLKDIEQKNLTDKNGDLIDSESILKIFNDNLTDENYWQDLYVMFAQLDKGQTSEYNIQQLIAEFGEQGFSEDALTLVNCADSAPKLSKDDYIKQAKIIDKQAPYDDITPKRDDEYLDACYHWQWQAADDLNENLVTTATPNLLFVAQKYDFATPFANAKTMADRFNDTLIYTPYYGHTVSLSDMNACVDTHVVNYLINPKTDFGERYVFCQ